MREVVKVTNKIIRRRERSIAYLVRGRNHSLTTELKYKTRLKKKPKKNFKRKKTP